MAAVITGSGMITSVGNTPAECFDAFCNGVTGNKPLQAFNQKLFNVTRAYEIADRAAEPTDVTGRATKWLCEVVNQAVKEAGLIPGESRIVTLIGTGLRELRSLELWWADGQPFHLSELHFANGLRTASAITGPIITLSNACAASSFALGLADDLLSLDQADTVIIAGSDSITESMFGIGDRASMARPERVQPFERERRGALLGEGAAAVVVESPEHASKRGASARAFLHGVGMSCDAFHETAPQQAGMVRAMVDALSRAGLSPGDIDLIMAHGTGTALNDQVEALSIREVFGDGVGRVLISGLKSMIGHTSGASGLVAVVTAVESLIHGRVPPTIGFEMPIDEAESLDIVAGKARVAPIRTAQVNAFGFGGVNAVVIIGKTP